MFIDCSLLSSFDYNVTIQTLTNVKLYPKYVEKEALVRIPLGAFNAVLIKPKQ